MLLESDVILFNLTFRYIVENNLEPCVLLAVGIKKDDYELEKRFRFDNQNIFSLYN